MSLIVIPRYKALDTNGLPISGALLYVFQPDTEDLKDIFLDAALSVPASNPLVADGNGDFTVFYGVGSYKLRLTDATNSPIWTEDNIETLTVSDATDTEKGIVQFATPAQIAARTAGFVIDTKDTASIPLDANQIQEGTLSQDRLPNISPSKVNNIDTDPDETLATDVLPQATEDAIGAVEKATAVELQNGDADKYPDAAVLDAAYGVVIGDNYMFHKGDPNGFLIASGSETVPGNGTLVVNIPNGYSMVGDYGVTVSPTVNDPSLQDNMAVIARNATTFTLLNGSDAGATVLTWTLSGRATAP